jgi:hypothetical protein
MNERLSIQMHQEGFVVGIEEALADLPRSGRPTEIDPTRDMWTRSYGFCRKQHRTGLFDTIGDTSSER